MSLKKFIYNQRFELESGGVLPELELGYQTFGKLNADKSNVIWVCHALTANSNVFEWWLGLFGEGELFNPEEHFIICANNLGSCYGSTGPLSINPYTKENWFGYFPQITIKDIARSFELLRSHLGVDKIQTLIGGSQGGQIAQEWALLNSSLAENLILLATNAKHSAWGIAFNESQRLAIKADRTFYSNCEEGGTKGLAAARSIALLSYRSFVAYENTEKEEDFIKTKDFASAGYQRYQGDKLVRRFNAYSYVSLLDAMDSHNLARGRSASLIEALAQIECKTLVISISSDILFPSSEQKFIARHVPNAAYASIDSTYGHDGFLIETKKISKTISAFLKEELKNEKYLLHKLSIAI